MPLIRILISPKQLPSPCHTLAFSAFVDSMLRLHYWPLKSDLNFSWSHNACTQRLLNFDSLPGWSCLSCLTLHSVVSVLSVNTVGAEVQNRPIQSNSNQHPRPHPCSVTTPHVPSYCRTVTRPSSLPKQPTLSMLRTPIKELVIQHASCAARHQFRAYG